MSAPASVVDCLGRERPVARTYGDGSFDCPFCSSAVPTPAPRCENPWCSAAAFCFDAAGAARPACVEAFRERVAAQELAFSGTINSVPKSAVDVDATYFEFAHGRMPRGRGGWAFGPRKDTDAASPEMFWFSGLYGDARRAAVAHFAARGVSTVYVQS